MTKEEYIASGLLELYVAGALSEKENQEVYEAMLKYPEVSQEVLQIETAVMKLTASVSKKPSKFLFNTVKNKLGLSDSDTKVVSLKKSKTNWFNYTGWAAAVIIGAGFLWTLNTNNKLKTEIQTADIKQGFLEAQIENSRNSLKEANAFITVLRDKDIISVPLDGQTISPKAYAQVYWDKKTNILYLDATGLPEPPKGKVYQFWSLTLNPLTPTDMGVI